VVKPILPTDLRQHGPPQWDINRSSSGLQAIGVDYSKVHLVPDNGASDLLPRLPAATSYLGVQDVTGAATLVKAGQLDALAVTSTTPSPLSHVPTLARPAWNGVSARLERDRTPAGRQERG